MKVSTPGTHFTAESTKAMRMMCPAQGHNMLMLPGFEPSTPGTHFTVETTEAMRMMCPAQGHNILMPPGFELSTSVS